MIRTTLRHFYILTALKQGAVGMIAATYVTFLLSKGLNLFEVNLVNVAFFVTLFVCEIPTGAFADIFGRKASFLMSAGLLSISMIVYGSSDSFWWFVVAEIIGAIGATFASGAFDSWVVDQLTHHGYTDSFHPIFSKQKLIGHGVGLLAALLGAKLGDISLVLPWFVGAALACTALFVGHLTMTEGYFVRQQFSIKEGVETFKNTITVSVHYGLKNANIRFIMILTTLLSLCVMAPNMQWQPYFKQWSGNQTELGYLWVGMALSLMFGSWLAPKLLKLVTDERKALIISHALIGAGIGGTVVFTALPPALFMFLMHEAARGMVEPLKNTYLHDNVPSKERATVISFGSIAHHIGGAVGLVISGALAQYGSIGLTWAISGGALVVASLFLWRKMA